MSSLFKYIVKLSGGGTKFEGSCSPGIFAGVLGRAAHHPVSDLLTAISAKTGSDCACDSCESGKGAPHTAESQLNSAVGYRVIF